MSPDFPVIEQLVIDFLEQSRALNQWMRDDQRSFSANDMASLEESDLKKLDIQVSLRQTIEQLEQNPAITITYGDLFVKLSYYAGTVDAPHQSKLLNLIQAMREEYTAGLRLTLVNRKVVNENLAVIKQMMSHLTQTPIKTTTVTYNQTGVLA